jgi:sortase A
MKPMALVMAVLLLVSGSLLLAGQGWLAAKAGLAGILIDRAYEAHLEDGLPHLPWHWADTYPLARLEVPRLDVTRTVLAGASGSSLAFGPGHVDGTVLPNAPGNSALAGHRDSWFAFLAGLRVGDDIFLETPGARLRFRVSTLATHSMWDSAVLESDMERRLTLITCFPIGGVLNTDQRFVVTAYANPRQ